MRRPMIAILAFALGLLLALSAPTDGAAMQKGDKKKKKAPEKATEKLQYLVNEDFRDVKGTLPEGWVNRANGSGASVVSKSFGAIHPVAGKNRIFHSFDVPAAIEGDFVVEIKFSSFEQSPIDNGKPQFPNLGVLLLDSKGKPASKDAAVQAWQEVKGAFGNVNGFLTVKANGDERPVSTKPGQKVGEGTPHVIRLERKGKDYEIAVAGDVIYTGTLGDLGKQDFSGIRIGMLGGDNILRKGMLKEEPVVTMVHFVKIGLKK
ncbi:MAG: hypothetical protein U0791_01645 [Gemmataceae bacterium]